MNKSTLELFAYHVAIIMDPSETRIDASPHRDVPPFNRELSNAIPGESRHYVRRLYAEHVARHLNL